MIERITEIADGLLDYDKYDVGCSVERIEDTIDAGAKKPGEFYVLRRDEGSIKGLVYSSDHRIKVGTECFLGKTCRIEYEINATGLRNGDCIDGEFIIVSNCGEWTVPYHISVIYVQSELVESMKSLDNFSELARTNWDAALRLCESSEFLSLPFMQNTQYAALYQVLRNTAGRNNLLEEFLLGTGVKEPVTVSITDKQVSYVRTEMRSSDFISIKKNTWGYVQLSVSSDTDFIIPLKTTILPEDFEDDICTLEYKIDEGRLHGGCNLGRIIIESFRQRFVINVSIDAKGAERDKRYFKYKKGQLKCLRYYIDYYTKPSEADRTLGLLRDELYEIIPLDESNVKNILAVAWISIMNGDNEEAARVLNRVRSLVMEGKNSITPEYCIFYYLCYISHNGTENLETLLRLLHRCYDETKDLSVFRLLLKVEPEWENNPVKKLEEIKGRFEEGCSAPWLYMEGCQVYINNPELLDKLESFELNCMWFGAKAGILPASLAEYISSFSSTQRDIDGLYLRILMRLYQTHKTVELLRGVCNALLKSDARDTKYFEWYKKGVEQGLRLTKLYEYYIYSMPEDFDEPIPRAVLLYFSYAPNVDVPSKITIYRNVIKYYAQDEQIRTSYAGQIEAFTIDQMMKGYVDDGMRELYNNVIYEELIDRRLAPVLPKMLYAAGFNCPNKKIRKIALCYEELNYEQILVPWNNNAYTVLYSDNYVVAGIDIEGRRYAGLDIEVTPVFDSKSLANTCRRMNPDNEILKIRESIELFERSAKGEMNLYGMLDMLQNNNIRASFKADIVSRLIDYYKQRRDRAPEALLNVNRELIGFEDRQLFIELLAVHGKFQKAYALMKDFGWSEVSDRSLMDTASRMIVETRFDLDRTILEMSKDCIRRGCFNQRILEYLLCNYNGDKDTMLEVMRAAVASNVRKFDFTERLLSQLIFTSEKEHLDEIFDVYLDENQKDETVVQAYLAIRSKAYLTEDEQIPEVVFDVDEQFIRAGRMLTDVTRLALCKYYSTLDELSEERCNLAYKYVYSYCRSGIVFSFFQKLGRFISLPDGLEDKIIIEYRTDKDNLVLLKTRIIPDDETWHEEMLPHMFAGFFVKVITLLRGEVLEYEIIDGADTPAESGSILMKDESAGLLGEGRNVMINRLLDAKVNNDLGRLVINAESYALLNELTDRIFTLL